MFLNIPSHPKFASCNTDHITFQKATQKNERHRLIFQAKASEEWEEDKRHRRKTEGGHKKLPHGS